MPIIDGISIVLGRLVAVCGIVFGVVYVITYLTGQVMRRAGWFMMFLRFMQLEIQKDPRGVGARLAWGKKED